MATTTQQIADKAWIQAQDNNGGTGTRWPSAEVLVWINDAQREVAMNLPAAYVLKATGTLIAGSRQTLAGMGITNGASIVDIPRNTVGRAITKRERAWMDNARPEWHDETSTKVVHWFYDERDPTACYVYPSVAAGTVDVVYHAIPADLANLAASLVLSDIYANAVLYFTMASMYAKDLNSIKSQGFATYYRQLAMQSLGLRDRAVLATAAQTTAKAQGT